MSFLARPPRRPDRPGTRLCRLSEITDGTARGFELEGAAGEVRGILVVRLGDRVHGYLNVCPHAGTPLEMRADAFLSPDGAALQCATHAARFRKTDGACLAGPCNGKGLSRVPLHLHGRTVALG